MKAAAEQATTLIPGAAETVKALRAKGIKIGSGTGYTREMMANILPRAAEQGYAPDALICAGETPSGRPSPLMAWAAMIQMDAWPARACIKVDDAPVGIIEGKLAGCWTVGLSASGNGVGLTRQDFQALGEDERSSKLAIAERQLLEAGADFVIPDISQLMAVVDEIAQRISAS
jgi:phosphonoacetaldehyde hydrolase